MLPPSLAGPSGRAEGGVPEVIYVSGVHSHHLGTTLWAVSPVKVTTDHRTSFGEEANLLHRSQFMGPKKGLYAEGNSL